MISNDQIQRAKLKENHVMVMDNAGTKIVFSNPLSNQYQKKKKEKIISNEKYERKLKHSIPNPNTHTQCLSP